MKKILLFFCLLSFAVLRLAAQCDAPTNVQASALWDKVNLTWESSLQSVTYSDSLTYGGTQGTGIGAGTTAFAAVVRFTPDSLTRLSGSYLTHVKFTLYSLNLTYVTVKVWQGGSYTNGAFNEGTLVSSTTVDFSTLVVGDNIARLSTPVLVDNTQELWIGFETQGSASSTYPASATANLVANFNDLIYFGGNWTTLGAAGVEGYGWMVTGCFSNSLPDITGFNVYRNNTLLNTTPISNHSYVDTTVTAETQYCYTIESVCASTSNSSAPVCVTTMPAPNCGNPIGTGTGTSAYLPFYCFYNYSYTQQLYTASEMGVQGGTIVSIGFPYMYSSPQNFVNVKVYMANVTKTTFTSSTDWIPGSELTLVYDGPYSCNAADTFSTINFTTPFEWDGSSNVVVAMAYNEGSYYTSDARFYAHTATAGNTSLYVYQDGGAYNPNNPPSGTLSNMRNNILFCYGPEPDCYKPSHPVLSGITATGATLSWHPHSATDTQWDIVCVQSGQSVNSGTIIPVYDSTYTFTGLTDNTTYDVYLRTNCSTENSDWIKLTFHTECLAHQTIPYVENFNGYGAGGEDTYPFCWTRMTNYTSTHYPYVTTGGQLYFYSYENYYSLAVSQPLDLSAHTGGTLALSFYIGASSATYGRLDVGVMTDPNDMNTFTLLKSYYPSDYHTVGVFQQEFITLTETYQNPIYLAFYAPAPVSSTSNYVNVDNVRVDYLPTCSNPSDLTVSDVTGTAATISWTPAQYGATGYTLEYGVAGQQSLTPVTVTGNQYMLTGLTTNTEYEVYLYANCAEGMSDTIETTFTTLNFVTCTQPDTNALNVSDTTISTTTTYQVPVNNFYKYSYTQQIIPASALGSTSAVLTGIGFYYNYSTAMSSKTDVKIYLAHRSSASFASTSDWTPISEATLVYEGTLNCTQGWNVFDFDNYFSYNGNDNLVVIVDDNSYAYNGSSYVFRGRSHSTYRSLYYQSDSNNPDPANPPTGTRSYVVCDMELFTCSQVAPISCPEPMVYTTAADDESVTVAWVSNGSETEWELQYKEESSNTWTSAGSMNASPYTINNLTSDTHYDIRLCAVCSATDSSEWAYTTAYTPCVAINIPYTENFDNQTANQAPGCWTTLYNTTNPTPVVTSSYAHSGTKSLYFNCSTAGNYAYGILPRLDDLVEMNDLQVQFQAYKTSAAYMIEVGVMTDPTDPSTFTVLGSFSPSAVNTWELGEVLTNNYSGNGHYLAFRIPQWYANSIYIDDVDVQNIPSCPHVSNIYATTIEATSAVIKWTAGDSETQWAYLYGPAGTVDPAVDNPLYCNEDTVALSGLIPNTLYTVYVQAYCSSSDQSTWMNYSFRSGCATMTQLPYSENFDSYAGTTNSSINVLPNCWSRINNGSSYTGFPTVYSSSSYSGANCLGFYVYNSTYYSDQYAILPEIDTMMLPINTLQMTLAMASRSTSYPFIVEVGVMSDPTDVSTFIPVQTLSTSTTSYVNQSVYFDSFGGGGQYIALKVGMPTSSYNYGYIDDIVLSVIPECSPVSELTVSNVAGTSALVSWEAGHYGNTLGYTLEFTESGQDSWIMASNSITGTSYMLSNLTPNTSYDVRVITNCDLITSAPVVKTFSTACLAGGDIAIGEGTITNSYFPQYSFYNYSYTQQIYTASELGGTPNTLNSISFDLVTVNTPNRNLSVYLLPTTESAPTTWLPAANAQLVFSGPVNLVQGWNTFHFSTPFAYDGVSNLAVIVVDGTGSYSSSNSWKVHTNPSGASSYYMYNDASPYGITSVPSSTYSSTSRNNVIFGGDCDSIVTCVAPNLYVNNVTTTSADVNWVNGYMENAWEMDYKKAVDSVWTPVPNPTGYMVQLTNLQPSTVYDVRMRSDCGGEYSNHNMATFTTECGAISTLPYQEYFDTYGTGEAAYPLCWGKINTYSSPRPYVNTGGFSAPGLLYFFASSGTYNVASTPEFDQTININTLQVSFKYKAYYASDRLVVGVISDPDDISTFTPVDTIVPDPSSYSSWSDQIVYLNNYQGNGHRIAFLNAYTTTSCYAYVDNLEIDVMPTCLKPTNFTATADNTSVTLSWTENGTATAWDIEYGTQGFTPGTGTTVSVTTNPYTITGLATGTTYDFYVRANCGGGDESDWSGVVSATPGSYTMPTSGEYTVSMCGGVIYDDGGINGDYSTNCDVTLVVNPDTAGMMVHLTGTYDCETSWDELTIYDGNSTSGTLLFSSDNGGTLDVVSTTGPLTIHFESDGSVVYSGFEIQVSCESGVTPPEPCDAPTNLVATPNMEDGSVQLDWAQQGTPDSWTVSYKQASAGTWSTTTTSTRPYTLTNLVMGVEYTAFVVANCGEQTSGESNHITFTPNRTGVNDYLLSSTVVYPNPTTGEFRIENSELRIENVEVYDVYGKLITTVKVEDNSVVIDLSDNASGVYFTRISTEKGVVTKRIVKK